MQISIWLDVNKVSVREEVDMALDGAVGREVGGLREYAWVTGEDCGDLRWDRGWGWCE